MDENNQSANNIGARKVIRVSRKKLITTVVVIIVLAVIAFGVRALLYTFGIGTSYDAEQMSPSAMPCIPSPGIDCSDSYNKTSKREVIDFNNNKYQTPSSEDTREFLKTSFSASIKTRKVQETVTDIKNIIKGADGRIDNFYSSEKSGRISFVINKSKFDAFKNEIEGVANTKLYTETTSSENLLGDKQKIEAQTAYEQGELANYKNQKDTLATSHTKTVSSINKELTRIRADLVKVRAIIAITTMADTTALRNQEASLVAQETAQMKLLNSENSSYETQNKNLESAITSANIRLTQITNLDSQFTDYVETVNGSISVNWISLWEMAKIFSPIHPTLIIIILVIAIGFFLKRNRHVPKVVLQ